MTQPTPPQYRSPTSTARRDTLFVDSEDPRLQTGNANNHRGRSGADIAEINAGNSGSLNAAGVSATLSEGGGGTEQPPIYVPPIGNQPPKYYPGGSGPYVYILDTPTNVTAQWQLSNPNNLEIDFTWDPSSSNNSTATSFNVYLTDGMGNSVISTGNPIVPNTTSQSIIINQTSNMSLFNVFTTTFTSIGVQADDPLNNTSAIGYAVTMPVYVLQLNSPKIIPAGVNLGYTINFWEDSGTYGNGTFAAGETVGIPPFGSAAYDGIEIWEVESPINNVPVVLLNSGGLPIGWTRSYIGKLDPVTINTTDTLYRYVIARFASIGGVYSQFCSPVGVQPINPVSVNVKVPTEATATAVWGGTNNNSIIISYTLPGSTASITAASGNGTTITYTAQNTFNAGDPVQITGVTPSSYNVTGVVGPNPTSTSFTVLGTTTSTYTSGGTASSTNNAGASFITTLSSNSQTGFFYYTPTSISLSGTITLSANSILNYFSEPLPTSFNILFQSVSAVGVKSNGISVSISSRTDSLSSIKPDGSLISVASTVDGYTVNANYSSTDASTMQVYQFFTNPTWVGDADVPDYIDAIVSSPWSSSSPNQIVVNSLTAENGGYSLPSGMLPYAGYQITSSTASSTYIAGSDYNYITSITGTGPYTLTLKNPLTSLTAPPLNTNVHLQLKSYDGTGPANIFLSYTSQVWLIVALYNVYGGRSKSSTVFTVTPTNATTTLINQAISVSKGSGSIYLGSTATSLPNVIIGESGSGSGAEAGIFVWGNGSGTTLNTAPSTSIIGDANSPYTFVTSNAQIADWSITGKHIQNDLSNGTYQTGYVGLSGSNPSYSIWAGAGSSDNTGNDAKFSVTPAGQVKASNIQITGGNLDIGAASYSYTGTGTINSNTLTVSSITGITTGMYVFGSGIQVGTTVTAVGTNTVTLSKILALNITSSPVQFVSTTGSHITSTGNIVAANAILSGAINATSGSFTGNINIGNGGSLYSGSIDLNGNLTSAGYIINTNGLYFTGNGSNNNTYITPSGLTTTAANIGGWNVNSNQISRIGSAGTSGTISLNSLAGTISVSATNVSSYSAGINGPYVGGISTTPQDSPSAPIGGENVFWAGTGGAASASNAFRVTIGGNVYAQKIYSYGGLVQVASGASSKNIIQLDSTNEWLSLGDSAGTSYLVSRNNNIYLTSPAANTTPWSTTSSTIPTSGKPSSTDTSSPTGTPYLAAGSSFKDPYGTKVSGIGIYTGDWDYFTKGQSKPFITATTTGLQLSASPDIGMLVEGGGAPTDNFTQPTILIYTANNSGATPASYSPSTSYGAWAKFQSNQISLNAAPAGGGLSTTFININGNTSTPNTPNSIIMQASPSQTLAQHPNTVVPSNLVGQVSDTGYAAAARIQLNSSGTYISGIPYQGGMILNYAQWDANFNNSTVAGVSPMSGYAGTGYLGLKGFGPVPRARVLVQDPTDGTVVAGLGIYYQDTSVASSIPDSNSGVIGDLWITY